MEDASAEFLSKELGLAQSYLADASEDSPDREQKLAHIGDIGRAIARAMARRGLVLLAEETERVAALVAQMYEEEMEQLVDLTEWPQMRRSRALFIVRIVYVNQTDSSTATIITICFFYLAVFRTQSRMSLMHE